MKVRVSAVAETRTKMSQLPCSGLQHHCLHFVAGSSGKAEEHVAGELCVRLPLLLLLHSQSRHSQIVSFVEPHFPHSLHSTQGKLTTSKRDRWTGNRNEVSHHSVQQHQEAKENVRNEQNNNTTKLQYQTYNNTFCQNRYYKGGNINVTSTDI
jgi:hypothetical protein